jgi:hypothetical protein
MKEKQFEEYHHINRNDALSQLVYCLWKVLHVHENGDENELQKPQSEGLGPKQYTLI